MCPYLELAVAQLPWRVALSVLQPHRPTDPSQPLETAKHPATRQTQSARSDARTRTGHVAGMAPRSPVHDPSGDSIRSAEECEVLRVSLQHDFQLGKLVATTGTSDVTVSWHLPDPSPSMPVSSSAPDSNSDAPSVGEVPPGTARPTSPSPRAPLWSVPTVVRGSSCAEILSALLA